MLGFSLLLATLLTQPSAAFQERPAPRPLSQDKLCDCYTMGEDGHPLFIGLLSPQECKAAGGRPSTCR